MALPRPPGARNVAAGRRQAIPLRPARILRRRIARPPSDCRQSAFWLARERKQRCPRGGPRVTSSDATGRSPSVRRITVAGSSTTCIDDRVVIILFVGRLQPYVGASTVRRRRYLNLLGHGQPNDAHVILGPLPQGYVEATCGPLKRELS